LAAPLAAQLRELGTDVTVLESDELRKVFTTTQTSYGEQDRDYFYGSLAFIGRVLTDHGISVIFDATANLRVYGDRSRRQIARFIEVFVDCPLATCIQRDPKGIYRKAGEGQASHVPGLQVPYEPPESPELVIRGDRDDPAEAARKIISVLVSKGFVPASRTGTG
jgi:adenylylsulfate kinase